MGAVDAEGRAATHSAAVYDDFLSSNYMRTARDCDLSRNELVHLAVNSFEASLITDEQKQHFKDMVAAYCATWGQ